MRKLILLLLVASLFPSDAYAIGYYSWYDTLNVFALSGLHLRDKPGGAVIVTLPYGSKIIMQEYQPNDRCDTVENIPGHWAKADWQGKKGYVFDGFLSRLPAPDTSLNTLQGYCDRYFAGSFIPDSTEMAGIDIQHYKYGYFYVELESSQNAEESEAYGYYSTMTIRSGDRITPEEMYLLMRALFRDDIAKCPERMKTGKQAFGEFYKTADQNYFQFIWDAKSGSYEFPGDLYNFLDYGVCIHGAYISFGAAD